ncbi:SUR7 family protein pun1 like [Verticillium longisporum]|uniref:SUR7 family protein pun1 like n=1 Tax=Verticillium longisporum TaxID=100787 RepID=A0A8I2ZQQ4_VERLO|nr:SUR7 family protein pun1 like [Verticillium longisporum]
MARRRNSVIVAAVCYLIAIIFLILVLIGNTSNKPVLRDIFFFRLDVANVIPISTAADATLLNTNARTLGLHDFYQIGLWNFCQGYSDEGVTECFKPEALWWFNPIEVLTSQLFTGAVIALPKEVTTVLTVLRLAQQIMFGFFLSGICSPSILGTAMSVVARYALTAQSELNLRANLGARMFAFMWVASTATIVAFFVHAIMGCCCRRHPLDERRTKMEPTPDGSQATSEPTAAPSTRRRTGPGAFST